jgi:hypothetical protein
VLDADGDGAPDVFVTNDGVPNFLFHNNRDGTFDETALIAGVAVPSHGRALSSMGVDARDYDRDGAVDIAVTALTGETFPLFRGDGRGTFVEATHTSGLAVASARTSGWCAAWIDADNDGWPDLFTSNAHVNDRIEAFEATTWKQANSLFRNDGMGRFAEVRDAGFEGRPAAHRGCAPVDVDGDGRLDIVVSALGGPAELWRNASQGGHWLVVRLTGTRSNRDGIGAKVTVEAGGRQQVREVRSGGSYVSHNDMRVHVGLGRAAVVDRVTIRWPSGQVDTIAGIAADRFYVVREGGGIEPR